MERGGRREEGGGRGLEREGRGWEGARRRGGGVGEEEEVTSSKEDPFPMEMHSGWCPLASLCIMRGRPIVMQINSDDNTLSSTTSRLGKFLTGPQPMPTGGRTTIFH